MELQGRTALVTGAGSGIGKATALKLAAEGARVAVLSRTGREAKQTRDEIRSAGGEAISLKADTSDEGLMRDAIATLLGKFGGIDIVVANAGINGVWAPIDDLKPQEWDKTMAVNLRGTYLTLHLTVPYMKSNGGSIIVVSSINGTRTFTTPGATAYTVTKAGQVAMVQQLALELGKHGIRVNAVCPGAIDTNISDNTRSRHREETEIPVVWPEGEIPISGGEAGHSADVAEAILFLATERSRHITGTPIWIDGGQGLLR
ncbi:SDR family oxidoreductase [Rhizobium sp. SEMIA 4085]|uniref:3-oxoacyl-(Acyl-carrier-protein) reductase 1 n=1 Tax=Rhizobium gallicum bv. gallicum R602sp TaxID=1041138 RepID=A0A0B4X6X9_9HYPH|nr:MULTISPECIES: SDR family NAD(P)-dependent oxidoreductase [Rhizobium]AJD42916.1 3-oxoacyl-(acyl-carrier-protein) reductase 1 [Rhizobium gallicum bv. gallicum R602sp]NNH28006.1 SDR family oxidoreductase [Rhizobium sp. SEMIA 4085]TDW35500.1 NAD(P)-dependent dehydrogenase (short-subunit alcohol dehydrogenase family) [Rhizobium azibense]